MIASPERGFETLGMRTEYAEVYKTSFRALRAVLACGRSSPRATCSDPHVAKPLLRPLRLALLPSVERSTTDPRRSYDGMHREDNVSSRISHLRRHSDLDDDPRFRTR